MANIFLLETLSGYPRSLHYTLLPSLERLPPKAEEFFLPMRQTIPARRQPGILKCGGYNNNKKILLLF